ncbi:MAG: metal ABC transporter permease, partial [Planctomyces sp.]
EALEPGHDLSIAWSAASVARGGVCSPATLRRAERKGLIKRDGSLWRLTEDGRAAAARVVRSHRLWELYLIEQADIAADHVDRDADQLEHVLPAPVLAQLESRLAQEGRLPATTLAVVPSPHPLSPPPPVSDAPRRAGRGARGSMIVLATLGALALAQPARAADAPSHEHARVQAVIAAPAPAATLGHADTGNTTGEIAQIRTPPRADGVFFRIGTYEVRADDFWTAGTAVVCCVSCGVLGCFLVLRRMSLLGDAISHAILPGLALAFIITQSRAPGPMIAGAMIVGVLTALLSGGLSRWGKVPEDASMGVVFTTLFALGVLLITLAARDVDIDPGCVLYGSIELVALELIPLGPIEVPRAFAWLGAVLLINLTLLLVFYKELKIVCFDPALATTLGISATVVHYGLMTAVATTSVAAFESVGSILVIAMLVAPGATAHLLTDRLSRMLLIAAGISALSAVAGYAFAVALNTSVAGMIASVSLVLFVLAVVAAPRHGVLARVLFARRLKPIDAAGLPAESTRQN